MNRRMILAATLTAALALAGLTTGVAAQDADGAADSLTGVIVVVANTDGSTDYYLELEDGTQVKLSVGPPWYWGANHPLAPYDGQTVVLGGLHTGGLPSENASDVAKARGAGDPTFEVRSIDGVLIFGPGKPPWAGGPAVVGEAHPGFAGWSWGRQMSGAGDDVTTGDSLDTEGLTGGPAVVGEEHPGYEGWSKGQAAKAAKGDNAASAKAQGAKVSSAAKSTGAAKAQTAKANKANTGKGKGKAGGGGPAHGGGRSVAAQARGR
jgi:hypothetical protein